MKFVFDLCVINDHPYLLNRIQSPAELLLIIFYWFLAILPLLWITCHQCLDQPRSIRNLFLYIPKPCIMKAISTFVSLFLIITTCATSAVLYLNENYNLSAILCIVWIISLTLWIRSAAVLMLKERVTRNA